MFIRPWRGRVVLLSAFAALSAVVSISAPALAQDQEFQFNWLDPDKRVYVLQNRRYRKAGHALAWAMGGFGLSQPYRSINLLEPRLSFYISEAFGLEVMFSTYWTNKNNTFRNLETSSPSAIPQVREFRNQWVGLVHWAPWYAKINVFNSLLYLDWIVQAGAGKVSTEVDTRTVVANPSVFVAQDVTAFFLGTGHLIHISDRWLARWDLMAMFYQAPLFETSGANTWFTHFNFNIGVGFKL